MKPILVSFKRHSYSRPEEVVGSVDLNDISDDEMWKLFGVYHQILWRLKRDLNFVDI